MAVEEWSHSFRRVISDSETSPPRRDDEVDDGVGVVGPELDGVLNGEDVVGDDLDEGVEPFVVAVLGEDGFEHGAGLVG